MHEICGTLILRGAKVVQRSPLLQNSTEGREVLRIKYGRWHMKLCQGRVIT